MIFSDKLSFFIDTLDNTSSSFVISSSSSPIPSSAERYVLKKILLINLIIIISLSDDTRESERECVDKISIKCTEAKTFHVIENRRRCSKVITGNAFDAIGKVSESSEHLRSTIKSHEWKLAEFLCYTFHFILY